MVDGVKHTTAAEMEAFLSKSDAEQKLMIWLNGRETNGSVAEAHRQIAAQGREIQRLAVALSDHVSTPHMSADENDGLDEMVAQHRDLWTVWRFSRWFIPISIPASVTLTAILVELIKNWR